MRDTSKFIRVGFWKDTAAPFDLSGNPDPRTLVDPTWSEDERQLVAVYLDAASDVGSWMGFSYCRFNCGVQGTAMGTTDKSDGTYLWPQGLSHYVRVHSVRLPADFLAHIRKQLASLLKGDHGRRRDAR